MGLAVLFVCTGNVCRSPMAEYLLRAAVSRRAELTVASAGLNALVGSGMAQDSVAALERRGIDPGMHRARRFEAWMAASADLVLTAEIGHRDRVLATVPAALRRTFTMKEFARLARHTEPVAGAAAGSVIDQIAGARGNVAAVPAAEDDIADPFRRSAAFTSDIADQIEDTVRAMMAALCLPARPSPVAREAPPRRRPLPAGANRERPQDRRGR